MRTVSQLSRCRRAACWLLAWGCLTIGAVCLRGEPVTLNQLQVRLCGFLQVDSQQWAVLMHNETQRSYMIGVDGKVGEDFRMVAVDPEGNRVCLTKVSTNEHFWIYLGNSRNIQVADHLPQPKPVRSSEDLTPKEPAPLRPYASLRPEAQKQLHDPKFIPVLENSGIEVPESLRRMAAQQGGFESRPSRAQAQGIAAKAQREFEQTNASESSESPLVQMTAANDRPSRLGAISAPLVSNAKTAAELAAMRGE